jgi:hypothetical protein
MSNAFMKLYEMLQGASISSCFDIAGAPGMFIFAAERFAQSSLDWMACSLIDADGNGALGDSYRLYRQNPERYIPCDLTKPDDMQKCIDTARAHRPEGYNYVTGDVGIPHDDDFSQLQEVSHLDVQWGQAILALHLVMNGGICILKMYTYAYAETRMLVDILSVFFHEVTLHKPYTSRITNNESYLICRSRNSLAIPATLPLSRPYLSVSSYISPNDDAYTSFDISRNKKKIAAVDMMSGILHRSPYISIRALTHGEVMAYLPYWNARKAIYYALSHVRL